MIVRYPKRDHNFDNYPSNPGLLVQAKSRQVQKTTDKVTLFLGVGEGLGLKGLGGFSV